MNKSVLVDSKDLLIYQSTMVSKNIDETYEVKHVFVDENGREFLVRYPKVRITIDGMIDITNNDFNQPIRVFPYAICQVLPYGKDKELFTLEIK